MARAIMAHRDSSELTPALKDLCGEAVFAHVPSDLMRKHVRAVAEIFLAHELSA